MQPVKHQAEDPASPARNARVDHYNSWPSSLEQEWWGLWTATHANVFSSPAWVKAWMNSFGAYPLTIIEVRDGESLVGLLPLTVHRRPLHRRLPLRLQFLGVAGAGVGAADHVSPLATDANATEMLLKQALDSASNRSLLLEHLDGSLSGTCEALGFEKVGTTPVPRLDLSGVTSVDEIWSKKLRKNLRRRRRLAEEAEISGRWMLDASDLQRGLDILLELHLKRWRSRGETGLLNDQRMGFLRALCSDPGIDTRIYLLEGPGGPVAALLVFCTESSMSSYKTGWHPDYAALSLGIQVHADAIESSVAEHRNNYDFLRGTGGHKYALNARDHTDVTYGEFRGLLGRVLRFRERRSYIGVERPAPELSEQDGTQ